MVDYSSFSPLLLLVLFRCLHSTTGQTFDRAGAVITIEGLGYNDNVIFMCYGGRGKTTIPYFDGSAPPRYRYDNVADLVATMDAIELVGCVTRYVRDPSDEFLFMDECVLGDDSIITYCRGPLPDGIGFQCGRYDRIMGTSTRLHPDGPDPNCHEYDRYWFCPRPGVTRFNRYWMQEAWGFNLGHLQGSCSDALGGPECGDNEGIFMLIHGGNIFDFLSSEDPCNGEYLIDLVCPYDANYPRTRGCIRRRDLEEEGWFMQNDEDEWPESFAYEEEIFQNGEGLDEDMTLENFISKNVGIGHIQNGDAFDDIHLGSDLVSREQLENEVPSNVVTTVENGSSSPDTINMKSGCIFLMIAMSTIFGAM